VTRVFALKRTYAAEARPTARLHQQNGAVTTRTTRNPLCNSDENCSGFYGRDIARVPGDQHVQKKETCTARVYFKLYSLHRNIIHNIFGVVAEQATILELSI